jgi:hypothetical protein
MHPLSGRIYLTGDSKLNAINVGITLHDGKDAAMINLDIVAQLEPIAVPDFLVHRLRAALDANWYPDLIEALKTGRLRCDTNLTLVDATEQWSELGLSIDSLNIDIEAALTRNVETVTVAEAMTQTDAIAAMQRQLAEMQAAMANVQPPAPVIVNDQSGVIAKQAAEIAELKALFAAQQQQQQLSEPQVAPVPPKARQQVAL